MNKYIRFLQYLSLFLSITISLQAELLVIKKQNHAWVSLDDRDQHNYKKIREVIENYAWPTALAHYVSDDEVDELFSPDNPYAEEKFIAKKLKEINPAYDVIFIPTSVYELFAIKYKSIWRLETSINGVAITRFLEDPLYKVGITEKIIDKDDNLYKINEYIDSYNKKYTTQNIINLNSLLTQFIFSFIPESQHLKNAFAISQALQKYIQEITINIYDSLTDIDDTISIAVNEIKDQIHTEITSPHNDVQTLRTDGILLPTIELEYQARQENKALLFRGQIPQKLNIQDPNESEPKFINIHTTTLNPGDNIFSLANIQKNYVQNTLQPYSVSYGNSLFAGSLVDPTACAYWLMKSNFMTEGIAIFLDKKMQYTNPLESLFFIPPLNTLASLQGYGEWFHPRTKVAIPTQLKKQLESLPHNKIKVFGIGNRINNESPIIYNSSKDPMEQAQEYATMISQNGKILRPQNAFVPNHKQPAEPYAQYGYLHPEFVNSSKMMRNILKTETTEMQNQQKKFIEKLPKTIAPQPKIPTSKVVPQGELNSLVQSTQKLLQRLPK